MLEFGQCGLLIVYKKLFEFRVEIGNVDVQEIDEFAQLVGLFEILFGKFLQKLLEIRFGRYGLNAVSGECLVDFIIHFTYVAAVDVGDF